MKEVLLMEKEVKEQQSEVKVKLKTSESKEKEKKEKELTEKLFSTPVKEVVEKPNFDKIEELPPEKRKRVFKVSKEKEKKQKFQLNKKLKIAIVSAITCLLIAFCATTTVEIVKLSGEIAESQSQYEASLGNLIKKIYSTETGNRSLNLFETFPEEDLGASSFYESTNWFDKVCNYLAGLFGG